MVDAFTEKGLMVAGEGTRFLWWVERWWFESWTYKYEMLRTGRFVWFLRLNWTCFPVRSFIFCFNFILSCCNVRFPKRLSSNLEKSLIKLILTSLFPQTCGVSSQSDKMSAFLSPDVCHVTLTIHFFPRHNPVCPYFLLSFLLPVSSSSPFSLSSFGKH